MGHYTDGKFNSSKNRPSSLDKEHSRRDRSQGALGALLYGRSCDWNDFVRSTGIRDRAESDAHTISGGADRRPDRKIHRQRTVVLVEAAADDALSGRFHRGALVSSRKV